MVDVVKYNEEPRQGEAKECINIVILGHNQSGKSMLAGNLFNELDYVYPNR